MAAAVSSAAVDTAAVSARGVSAGYDGRDVIGGVELTVRRGELVALVGANGAGKSTLLKVIAGLLPARSGTIQVFGEAPGSEARRVAYLPQVEELRWDFPLRVDDLVLFGRSALLGVARRPGRLDREAVRDALAQVDALPLARRPIGALSGGQRQRVLLARTLVSQPQLMLLDEPATGVDPTTEEQLMDILAGLSRSGRTVIVATHDLAGVMAHFTRVVCMNGGVVADGPVSILRDESVLLRTYGGHRPGAAHLVDDEHHA